MIAPTFNTVMSYTLGVVQLLFELQKFGRRGGNQRHCDQINKKCSFPPRRPNFRVSNDGNVTPRVAHCIVLIDKHCGA